MLALVLVCCLTMLSSCTADHSVSICSVGFVSNLVQLLHSEPDDFSPLTGVELVRQKVKCLYLMAGVFTSSEEPNIISCRIQPMPSCFLSRGLTRCL